MSLRTTDRPITDAQLAANRANAQKSTGPRTIEGKQRSALNALKHGLSARTRVLPTEKQDDFDQLLSDYFAELQPKSRVESDLIEDMVAIRWHIKRVRATESSILELEMARPMFADEFRQITGAYRTAVAYIKAADRSVMALINRQATRLTREFAKLLKTLFDYRRNNPPAADSPTIEIDWTSCVDYRPVPPVATDFSPSMQNEPTTEPAATSMFSFNIKPLARAA